MSDQDPRRSDDPVNAEAQDWSEAGVPEQEDTTEDEALTREEPEASEALGSTAPDRDRTPAGQGEEPAPGVVEPGPGGPEEKALRQEEQLRQEDEGGRPGE